MPPGSTAYHLLLMSAFNGSCSWCKKMHCLWGSNLYKLATQYRELQTNQFSKEANGFLKQVHYDFPIRRANKHVFLWLINWMWEFVTGAKMFTKQCCELPVNWSKIGTLSHAEDPVSLSEASIRPVILFIGAWQDAQTMKTFSTPQCNTFWERNRKPWLSDKRFN